MNKFWNVENKVLRLVLMAMFTGAIALATAYLAIPTGLGGYVNLGDGIIFICAMLMGPSGAIAAGVGSALADMLAGFMIYMPATFVIKGAMGLLIGLLCRRKSEVLSLFMNVVLFIMSEIIMVLGYFGYECILYGFEGALAGVPANAIQACAGIVIGAVFAPFGKKLKV